MHTKTTIEKYSHFFVVKHPTPVITRIIYTLSANYTQFGMIKDPKTHRNRWAPMKTFAVYVDGGAEFRFHINQFRDFQEALQFQFVDPKSYTVLDMELYTPATVDLPVKEGWVLYDQQEEASSFILDGIKEGRNAPLLMMPTGSGKGLVLTAKIKIPGGWTEMGRLRVGDTVTAWDGAPTKVTGVYPQGTKAIYRITFADGRSTECDLSHLWRVYSAAKRQWIRVINTAEIERLLRVKTFMDRLYIDLPEPEDCPDKELELDPYSLGLLLGDGGTSNGDVNIATPDQHVVDHFSDTLPDGLAIIRRSRYAYGIAKQKGHGVLNPYITKLRKLGLMGKRAWEKHIPKEYFHGSIAQRQALVQGLLDTDGTVDKDNGTISFTSTSKELAEGMQYLIRSLGGIATITTRIPSYTYKGEKLKGRLAYTVFIRHKKPSSLFRLPRKKERTKDDNQYAKGLRLRIKSVEYVGHKESRCISVSHSDHLYVTDDFIVTHNTVTALATTSKIGYRFAVVVLAGYVDKWVKDIKNILDIDEKEIGVIDGGKKLSRSTFYPNSDLPTPKAFVISLNTITRWYGLYEERRTNPQLEAYDCLPWLFWEHLGIGTVIFDEVHQHFHAVYRTHAYLNVPVSISLSATLLSKDQTIRKVHGMMFPQTKRFDKIKMKRYITSWACAYQIVDFARSRLQTTDYGSNTYSQNAFEMSILRHKTIKAQYVRMILNLVERAYVDRYVEGDKLIIFVGRSMMAHKLVDELRKRWPQFSCRTFLEGDPPENMHEPDIRVTTVISGSTAHDIANLRVAIMTNSIDSPVANLQAFGRLREMKHRTEHADVHFYYVYCSTIPKQHEYHLNRHELFSDRTLEQKKLFLDTLVP